MPTINSQYRNPATVRVLLGFCLGISVLLAGGRVCQAADSAVILLYHHVAEDTPASTSISPVEFRSHLNYLKDNGFNIIPLDQMINSLKADQPLPEKSVVITFDDGYSSIYSTAFPLLQSFAYPFALFLSTQPIDDRQSNYMSWEQIREMADAGVIIANHMVNHPYMLAPHAGENSTQRLQRLREELLFAEQRIEDETGQSHRYLAYPYGEYDPAIKAMLMALNFIGLAQNSGAVGSHSDFLTLPRFPLAGIYANLDTASTKFPTLPFNVIQLSPGSPVTSNRSPAVTLKFQPGNYSASQIGCFVNNRPIPLIWLDQEEGIVELKPIDSLTSRRWHYICTAADLTSGRYYWHSVQWINLD